MKKCNLIKLEYKHIENFEDFNDYFSTFKTISIIGIIIKILANTIFLSYEIYRYIKNRKYYKLYQKG